MILFKIGKRYTVACEIFLPKAFLEFRKKIFHKRRMFHDLLSKDPDYDPALLWSPDSIKVKTGESLLLVCEEEI